MGLLRGREGMVVKRVWMAVMREDEVMEDGELFGEFEATRVWSFRSWRVPWLLDGSGLMTLSRGSGRSFT